MTEMDKLEVMGKNLLGYGSVKRFLDAEDVMQLFDAAEKIGRKVR